jgi:hypothetical protein
MRVRYTGAVPILLMHEGRVYRVEPGAVTDDFRTVPTAPRGAWQRVPDPAARRAKGDA